jgi:hypothetical protein
MKKAGKRIPAKLRPEGIADLILMLIFEKPSTRTRVSFDVAMRQLGGQTIALNHTDLQMQAANWIRRLRTRNMRKPPALPPELKRELTAPLRDDVLRTSQLIGRSLEQWL